MNSLELVLAVLSSRVRLQDLQLWRAILGLLWCLLHTATAQIPEDDSAVVARTCKDRFLVGMPLDLSHNVFVRFARMQFHIQVAQVPNTDALVSRSRGKDVLASRVERNAVDRVVVRS